ncbi:MEKHLA domain-containing protein [Streptomyces sp. NPDC059009]|uniref:MEKHLA domain-containing protein n=1 Tax=Streptomyces sp. NPDC059009 TaxID=3346694 RepID=UPI003693B4A1
MRKRESAELAGPHRTSPQGPSFAALLLTSHQRLVGEPLTHHSWPSDTTAADWLHDQAPFGLLAHDTAADPRFVYANRTAQRCFGYAWEEFIGLPSRLSAVPDAQEDRNAFVESVSACGYATGYRGRRVTKSGRPFWIEDVTMWNLLDADGSCHGQAAVFRSWSSV